MRIVALGLAFVAIAAMPSRSRANADGLLGLYVGVDAGQSHVAATGQTISTQSLLYADEGSFSEHHAAVQLMAGIRPIALLGAELDYLDLGHPSGGFNGNSAAVSMKGGAAFGMLYLPVPVVDIFLKLGVARIQTDINGIGIIAPNCTTGPCPQFGSSGPFALDRLNWSGAAGLGAQYRMGSLALRGEYEHFNAGGEHPSLLALGVVWSF